MRIPVSVANTFQCFIPRLSRRGRATDVFIEGFDYKGVIHAKLRVQGGAILKNWPSINVIPPSRRLAKCPSSSTLVPACTQVF